MNGLAPPKRGNGGSSHGSSQLPWEVQVGLREVREADTGVQDHRLPEVHLRLRDAGR